MSKRIHLIAAARPNFMKVAPLYHALRKAEWAEPLIIHTGQHYDAAMSDCFFADLSLPEPHHHLGVGSGTHADQTGGTMLAYERLLREDCPDLTVVVGDVNATAACAMVCAKSQVKLAHLEAGLRSFDRRMPEEVNRVVTDALADILWTPSKDADENLIREGVPEAKITLVGNIMIDSLEMLRPAIEAENSTTEFGLSGKAFGVLTLHRPSNVDSREVLEKAVTAIKQIAEDLPLIFPLHPRTQKQLCSFGMLENLEQTPGIILSAPLSYKRFMKLVFDSSLIITDSGGLQEESSYLGIPCFTLRENTERPITLTAGTNKLTNFGELPANVWTALKEPRKSRAAAPPLWDGHTAERVVVSIQQKLP